MRPNQHTRPRTRRLSKEAKSIARRVDRLPSSVQRNLASMAAAGEKAPERSLEQIQSDLDALYVRIHELGTERLAHSTNAEKRDADARSERVRKLREVAEAAVPAPKPPCNPLICTSGADTLEYVRKVLRFLENTELQDASEDAEFGRWIIQQWVADAQEHGAEQAERERDIDKRIIAALQECAGAELKQEARP